MVKSWALTLVSLLLFLAPCYAQVGPGGLTPRSIYKVSDGSSVTGYPYEVEVSPGSLSISNGVAKITTSGGSGTINSGTVNREAVYSGSTTLSSGSIVDNRSGVVTVGSNIINDGTDDQTTNGNLTVNGSASVAEGANITSGLTVVSGGANINGDSYIWGNNAIAAARFISDGTGTLDVAIGDVSLSDNFNVVDTNDTSNLVSNGVTVQSEAGNLNLLTTQEMIFTTNTEDSGLGVNMNDESNPFFTYIGQGAIQGGDVVGAFGVGMFYMNTYNPASADFADFGVYDAFDGEIMQVTGSDINMFWPTNGYAPINGIVTPSGNQLYSGVMTSTGWTGSFAAGYTHTTGNTNSLNGSTGMTVGAKYRLSFTLSSVSASSINVTIGGLTMATAINTNQNYIYNFSPISNTFLSFTPQATSFNGKISNISLTLIQPQFVAEDTTAAQPGGAIDSGYISLIGQGYNTTAVASQPVEWRILVQPSVATSLGGSLVMQDNLNNAGAGNLFTFGSNGSLTASSFNSISYNGGTGLALSSTAGGTSTGNLIKLAANNTRTNTTGSTAIVDIAATYNQTSGTTPNTDLLISRTETAVGSGAQLLVDMQVGGSSKFSIDDTGNPIVNGTAAVSCASGTISVLTEVVTNGIVTHC